MKTATQYHLSRLVNVHGTFSHVARSLGSTPRHMRRMRSVDMSPSCNRTLLMAGKLLLLRQLLRALHTSGAVTSPELTAAWKLVRKAD